MNLDDQKPGLDLYADDVHAWESDQRIHLNPPYLLTGVGHEFQLTDAEVRDDLRSFLEGSSIQRPQLEGRMADYLGELELLSSFVRNREQLENVLSEVERDAAK